jgi:YrbI family 3-deoxy-D-manno-octulosonate 8-phosphate phosphatase
MKISTEKLFARIKIIVFDFDGVFTDNKVIVFDDGREAVVCSRGDGLGLELLRKKGFKMLVLSKETNPVVAQRCKKLGLKCIQGIDDKIAVLNETLKRSKIDLSETAYVGNDINDLGCMRLVGLSIAVSDAVPDVKKAARYVTGMPGGNGAVREVCDLIMKIKKL